MIPKTAILVVDLQQDFVDPRGDGPGSFKKLFCVPEILRLLEDARAQDCPVIHVHTEHVDGGSLPAHLRDKGVDPYCVRGTDGAHGIAQLFSAEDQVVRKQSFSGFLRTRLEDRLGGIENVIITGVAANCCVLLTAFDAAERYGKRVFVPYQCVSASDENAYTSGLFSIAKSAATVVDANLLSVASLDASQRLRLHEIEAQASAWYQTREEQAESLDFGEELGRAGLEEAVNLALQKWS